MESKRGQMKMSFGMMFSIFLIILFLVLAFYGIKTFLGMKDNVQIKQFQENLDLEIEKMWKSTYGSKDLEFVLPNKVGRVCFKAPNEMVLQGERLMESSILENVEFITPQNSDFFCVDAVNNKIQISLDKEYGEPKVLVSA